MSIDPAIQVTRLPSGLTVVTETMPRVETVSLGAYVGAGTRHERSAENGVSHFLEHMAFKGTARRTAAQIAERDREVLLSVGCQIDTKVEGGKGCRQTRFADKAKCIGNIQINRDLDRRRQR